MHVTIRDARTPASSSARYLALTATLMSQPHIIAKRCTTLNPSTLLPLPGDGFTHCCKEETEKSCKPYPELKDTQLAEGETWYVDGSSSKSFTGKNQTGFAVVTNDTIVIATLPYIQFTSSRIDFTHRSVQGRKGKDVTIDTDSHFAHSTVHVFATQWARRGVQAANFR